MLLNILQCTGEPHNKEASDPRMSSGAKGLLAGLRADGKGTVRPWGASVSLTLLLNHVGDRPQGVLRVLEVGGLVKGTSSHGVSTGRTVGRQKARGRCPPG